MIRKDEVYKIGVFNKPHGIHGELQFTFTDDVFDRIDADYVVCLLDGILVPFFIEEYRFRSDSTALMKLEGVDDAERARMFTNVEVFFPIHLADSLEPDSLSSDYFVGFTVFDTAVGRIGRIVHVDTSTMNVLFEVQTDDGHEVLIPAQDDFVTEIDQAGKTLILSLPEGLLRMDELDAAD